ncbi:MAG: YfhO family protein [Oscillospiraceae bacterium]|nr:YfhO family protein [Oscillospiraceae bacterium]
MNKVSGLSGSETKKGNLFTRNYILLVSALLPAAVLFGAYVIFGIFPFGERSVLSLDLNAQYVYYFDYMYDVLAGKESLFYCWSRNLSGEFAGIIGYYLASPFNWIVWAFPRKMITEGLMVMMLAKAAASGLTSAILLKKQRGYSNCTAATFSVMYALCGFFIVQTMNPMWLDGLIGLPLVVMGIERLCERKSFALYVLSLLYVFVTNFYIGYMVGIFSLLYFVYFTLSDRSKKTRGASVFFVFGFSSLAAILMSCFMIMPVYMSLSNGKFAFSNPDYTPVENFNIADIFIKLFPTTYDTVRMEGLPILYCGTLALVMAAAYFASRKIPARERISGGVLIGILVLSMYIRPIDMLWHGGQMPNWLPYRYSFFVIFLLWVFGAQAFDDKRLRSKSIGAGSMVLLGMLLYSDYNQGHEFYDTNLIIVIPLLLLAVMSIMGAVYKKYGGHIFVKITVTTLVALEMLLNTTLTLFDMDEDIVFSDRSTYLGTIPYSRKITDAIHEMDDGFYRMEKTYHRCVNDPMALRMYGMSHSSSTLNSKAIKLLKSLGFSAREHYTRYDGATMLTDDIFGVKYVLSQYKCYVPYNNTVPVENELNVTVYENEDALGIAYLADKEIIGYSYNEYSPFLAQNRLASMLSGNKALTVFRTLANSSVSFDSFNITVGETTDAHSSFRKINDGDAWISYDITMPDDGAIYMYLPTDYERETQLYINGQYLSNYYLTENYSIEYLGTYEAGETFILRINLMQDSLYFKNPQFYYIDNNSLQRFGEIMGEMNSETTITMESRTELTINVTAEEDRALFTTIPYEKGWTAYIDSEEVEIKTSLDDALMCLEIPK